MKAFLKTLFPKITIRQIALSGIFLGLITAFKLLDNFMLKINDVAAWEIYMTIGTLVVLVLPFYVSLLILVASPFLWLAIGQTMQSGPYSILLDYLVPMLALVVVKASKNRYVAIPLVLLSGVIQFFSQSLSGKLFWDTPWWPSMVFNFPFRAITTAITLVVVFLMFNRIKAINNVASVKSANYYISTMTKTYVHKTQVLRRGYINKVLLFEIDAKKYVIKISNSKANTLETEYKATKVLFPEALLSDDHKALIKPYVTGMHINELNEKQKKDLIAKLDKFNNEQNLNLQKQNWNEYNHYRLLCPRKWIKKYQALVQEYENKDLVPCHHDLNLQNLLATSDSTVELIDFEWARMNHAVFDYASIFVYDQVILDEQVAKSKAFNDFVFMICVYGYLWTYSVPLSWKAFKYRIMFFQKIRKINI